MVVIIYLQAHCVEEFTETDEVEEEFPVNLLVLCFSKYSLFANCHAYCSKRDQY
jgi:hypothetical protein